MVRKTNQRSVLWSDEPIRGQYCHLHQLPVDVLEHEVDLLTVLRGEPSLAATRENSDDEAEIELKVMKIFSYFLHR